jgi:phytoene desaturase
VSLIEGQGGKVRCGAEVERILVEKGRATGVRLAGGETLHADVVVSNADSAWTYRYLVEPEERRKWTDAKVEGMRYSMGLFVWYFGTNRRYEDVLHHTILLGPRYRPLLEDIFTKKILADDFSLYLHRPTATDPGLAPEGCDSFYVLAPVPHLVEGGTDWAAEGERYRKKIEELLEATLLPGLSSSLVVSETMTPKGFEQQLSSFRGAGFGMQPLLTQSAYFRPHNKSEDVENLFLVGAGTHPGAGVPGVLSAAKVLDLVVPDPSAFRRGAEASTGATVSAPRAPAV